MIRLRRQQPFLEAILKKRQSEQATRDVRTC